uniref:K Homology domain-containing protein n=1 Tax=Aegilops tauschii subsp. strangulata TaxID=200361 RepID=A0A453TEF8_AEGTS
FTHFDLPVALSSPPGTPALDPEDGGGSDDLTRAVSLLSLAEAGLTLTAPAPWIRPPTVTKDEHTRGWEPHDDDLARVNKRTHARFLVTHTQAGLIIGAGGSTVEARSGARVRLSRHDQLLPGTDRRVMLVYGLLSQVMDAMDQIR